MRLFETMTMAGVLGAFVVTGAEAALLVDDGFEAGGATPGAGQYQSEPVTTDGTDNDSLVGQGPAVTGFDAGTNWAGGDGDAGLFAPSIYPRVNDTGLNYNSGLQQLTTRTGSAEILRDGTSAESTEPKRVVRETNFSGPLGDGIFVSALFQFADGVSGQVNFLHGDPDQTNFERDLTIGFNSDGHAFLGSGSDVATGASFAADTTHLVVGRFFTEGGTDKLELWVNPTIGGATPAATLAVDDPGDGFVANNNAFGIESVMLEMDSGGTDPSFIFDEIRVGESFADVTPSTIIPEPTALTSAGMLGLLLAGRRRRSAC